MLRPEAPSFDRLALVADSLSPPYGRSIRLPSRSISGPLRRNSRVSVRPAQTEIVVPALAVTDTSSRSFGAYLTNVVPAEPSPAQLAVQVPLTRPRISLLRKWTISPRPKS